MALSVVNDVPVLQTNPAVMQPPQKKRKFFSGTKGSGKPDRNSEALVEQPKLSHSQMGIHHTQMSVALDVTSLPAAVNRISSPLSTALRVERERDEFKFCHVIATAYNVWLLVDRQAVNRFGFGPTIASREMLMLHDISAAYVESFSAMVSQNGIKLSTSEAYIVPQLKRIILGASERDLNRYFGRELNEAELNLEQFPLADVLGRWEVLRAQAARFCGNLSNWRVPDCKPDFSLLDCGVVLDGQLRTSVGVRPLPQRLEKVCIALGLVKYTRLGISSYIPQVIHESDDRSSLALRCGCYSGLTMTREQAVTELLVGMAPLSRV